jgi:putative heme-binding domain-containing protein
MKHPNVPRFTHDFVVYEGAALPRAYNGKLFAVAPLQGRVEVSDLFADHSSFQTKDVQPAITSTDTWFRPVNVQVGPDGAVYVADMYEAQIAHLRHHEGKIDPTNGRIYRLSSPEAAPLKPFDLAKLSTAEIVAMLRHENKWQRRTALRLLGDRKDRSALPHLLKLLDGPSGQDALEALWGINLCGRFDEALATGTLDHKDPHVRLWTVRLLGDQAQVTSPLAHLLADMARTEPNVEVRTQLACSAKRLPAADALPIVRNLLARDEDATDPRLPLLLWWALESKCVSDRDLVQRFFEESALWKLPVVQQHILHRLMRRFAAAGTRKDLLTCARLLQLAPPEQTRALMKGFEEAFQGRSLGALPVELAEALAKHGGASLSLGVRQNKTEAVDKALAILTDDKGDLNERLQFAQIFGEVRQPRSVPVLLELLTKTRDDGLRMAALTSLASYDDVRIGNAVLALYPRLTDDARSVAQTLLASRKAWALELLEAVEQGKLDKTALPIDTVRKLTVYRDERVAALVKKHWGSVEGATSADMQKLIAKLDGVLHAGSGSPYKGKKLFNGTCAKCHRLFGQGGEIGPDLTSYKRDDIGNMLLNIVNPSAEIREGFETFMLTTKDGRVLTGFLVDKDNQVVVLRGADGQNVSVKQDQIDELAQQRKSLMPEGLLANLSDQQVRDLFAYLRSTQPLND